MTTGLALFLGLALLAVAVLTLTGGGLDRAIKAAIKAGDVTQVVALIDKQRPAAQPTAYNHAIRRLWDAYERPLAAALIKAFAARHHDAKIAQYWLKQLLTAESKLARETLDQEFLSAHYQPEVADCCGSAG
jgi:hypothetical protein